MLGAACFTVAAMVASSLATQFVAWRVGFHPAIGAPWFDHFYAPWRWIEWQEAAWAPNARATFQIVDAGLLATTALSMFGVVAASTARRRRPVRHEGVHGTARFQTEQEIRRSGLLPRRDGAAHAGVYIGGWTDAKGTTHYLRHDGPEHCIVIAPTRSGKGVGNVLPTLLSWPASCVVYDEKGELWALTAGWRATGADNVVIRWEPGGVGQGSSGAANGSSGFNFLDEVRLGTPHEVADAQNIAHTLCDPEGRGLADHWQRTSFALLTGLILHVLYLAKARGAAASLADVANALSNPKRKSEELWAEMVANRHVRNALHPVVAAAGRDMLEREARERGSVLSTAKTYLMLFQDPLVAGNTGHSDFRVRDLMNHARPVSLYVVTRGDDKERLRPLVRLMLTMITCRLMGVELRFRDGQPLMPHRHRLLLMLDEFPSLNRLHLIEDALPKCAGYGIKAYLATQDREQMFRSYGEHQSITGNCHIRIIYAPNEWKTGEWVSQMVGNTTIVKEDVTESGTRYGPMKHVSRTYHEVSRPLLTPNEIMQLRKPEKNEAGQITAPGEMVVFVAGEAPIRGTQILYFKDPVFSERAKVKPPASGSTTKPTMVFRP
nr:type IV secretory system conjugative DNA transfer family protein [Limobrevibacterium gyesilva]